MKQLLTFGANGELVAELVRNGVRFLLVGGLAVHFYVSERQADDMDLLIEQTPENADRLFRALAAQHVTPQFSKELIAHPSERPQQLSLKDLHYADLVTTGQSIDFQLEWERSSEALVWQTPVRVASRELLIAMKCSAGRERDLSDVQLLQDVPCIER